MDDAQVQDDYYLLEEEEEGNYENFFEVKPWYMWVVHIATASVTFWLQAALTEDRYVYDTFCKILLVHSFVCSFARYIMILMNRAVN